MRKKILFLIHTLGAGGAEKSLLTLIKNMDKQKYDITVMTIVDYGIYTDEVKKLNGIKYRYMFKSFFNKKIQDENNKLRHVYKKIMDIIWKCYKLYIKYFYNERISKHMIKEKYDIEVAYLEGMSAKIISKSFNKKSKKICWIHTDISNLARASIAFKNIDDEKNCYSKFNKIVCVSQDIKESFMKKLEIFDTVTIRINPIDTNDIMGLSKIKVKSLAKPDNPLICAVGRLSEEKGFDRLLKCHKRLLENGINNTIWIIGEGKERKNLEEYISSNNLNESVKLLGYKSNPYKYMNMRDVFVSSSYVEGLSTVLCEAVVLKKPIVSTLCPGVIEILGDGNRAGIVTENTENDLYNGLYEMLTNKDSYNQCKKNVEKRSNLFVLSKTIRQIEKLF